MRSVGLPRVVWYFYHIHCTVLTMISNNTCPISDGTILLYQNKEEAEASHSKKTEKDTCGSIS